MPVALEGLRTAIYPAPDLDAAKAWWTRLLGFGPYFDEPFYVGYEAAGYELGLLPTAPISEGALVYWGVADVAEAVAAAMAEGATEHAPAAEVGGGIVRRRCAHLPVRSSGSSTTLTSPPVEDAERGQPADGRPTRAALASHRRRAISGSRAAKVGFPGWQLT